MARSVFGVGFFSSRLPRPSAALAAIQGLCIVIFGIDLVAELPILARDEEESWAHILIEALGVAALVYGFWLAHSLANVWHSRYTEEQEQVRTLRGDFDAFFARRFEQWRLSSSQRDIALLMVRGIGISEIARLRGNQPGTVKSHMNRIFKAAGVHSRAEFIATLLDEMLDHVATCPPTAPQHGALQASNAILRT